jgi:indole-3-glycerol phosphate synthase
MHCILKKIMAEKEKEVRALKERGGPFTGTPDPLPRRDFKKAINHSGKMGLIAEIKFASPSAGPIRGKTDPVTIGRIYEQAGASAISLLTDQKFFGGDLKVLPLLKKAVALPILRKDFILDEIQVRESERLGADAVLLIARILSERKLRALLDHCHGLGLAALVEVHDRDDLEKARACGAKMIGINNRDLDTFSVNLKTTLDLIPHLPHGSLKVSESGISNPADIRLLKDAGVQAVLVGTSLMKSANLLEKTRELVEAAKK